MDGAEAGNALGRGAEGDADEGVCAAVVQQPGVAEVDEAFGEGGAGGVLAGLLPGEFRVEDGRGAAGEQVGGVLGGKAGDADGVRAGLEVRVAVFGGVLAVVEEGDGVAEEDGRRADLGQRAVEGAGGAGASSVTGWPGAVSTGVQWRRSGEVASETAPSPQYIQNLPWRRAATGRPSTSCVRMPEDLYLSEPYLLVVPKIGPCLVQWVRSGEVAMPTE